MPVRDLLLLLPRLARMIASLMADRDVPVRAKLALAAVALYLASPADLLPDLVPFVGVLDDILLVAVIVDGLLSYVDRSLLERYWPGDRASLDKVAAVARRLAQWVPTRVSSRVFGARRSPA